MIEYVTSRNSSKYLRKLHQEIFATSGVSFIFYEERQDSVVGI